MHICYITNEYPKKDYPHGGIGTFVYTMSKALVAKGHRVSIVGINMYDNKDEVINEEGVFVFRLAPPIVKGLTWYLNFQSINKKIKALHIEHPISIVESAELGLAFIKKIKSIKYVIRLHGGHHFFAEAEQRGISYWKGFQEKQSFKKADAFIAVSNYVKKHTEKYLSYNNKPLAIIMSPINKEVFIPKPEIKIDSNTLLFAGTVCEKKGIAQLIKAMPKVIKAYPNVKLKIFGRDWFFKNGNSYIAYLKDELIPSLGKIKDHIEFIGAVPLQELAEQYAAATLCVFPSLMETQGLVTPEAMAMQKLVLFSNVGPGPEIITHKDTGLLCDPYNEDDIADNILWALQHNKEGNAIAKKARHYIEVNFSIDTITHRNVEFYKTIQ